MSRSRLVFFSMPFGIKEVSGKSYDFDKTWQELLSPAVPADWKAVRLDLANEPGSLPDQFKHYLRVADVGVFDLTSANPNVLYELGLRDVFAPGRRVLVAREGEGLPFNLRNENTLRYPADQGLADAAVIFTRSLRAQILAAGGVTKDGELKAPADVRLCAQIERATTLPALVAVWRYWSRYTSIPADVLLRLAAAFNQYGRLDLAVEVSRRAYLDEPHDWDVARMLGWYLRKSGELDAAREYLDQALALNPGDVESMGMLGGMHKRKGVEYLGLGKKEDAAKSFALSLDTYQRAVDIEPRDVYNLVNVGGLTFVTEGKKNDNPAYAKVVELVEKRGLRDSSTWDLLALGEAHLVLGHVEEAKRSFAEAVNRTDYLGPMRTSVTEQLDLLEKFGLPPAGLSQVRSMLAGEKPRAAKGILLVHLSDVHFGKKPTGEPMHRFSFRGGAHSTTTLAQHVASVCADEKMSDVALFVIISGDIAYQAKSEEYKEAAQFVNDLKIKSGLEIDSQHLIVVPGNHDVNWALSSNERTERFDEFLKFARGVFGKKEFHGFYPFVTWDFDVDNPRPKPHEIVSVHKAKDEGVVFIGFNSCVLEDDKQHFGAIGHDQVALAREALRDVDPSWLRIAVLHHHVLPLERQLSTGKEGLSLDGTIVRDFAVLETSLHDLKFDMVLHGHKHSPGVRVSKLVSAFPKGGGKSMIVCGAGSAGVEQSELPPDRGNHFATYRIPGTRRIAGAPFVEARWLELPYNDLGQPWIVSGSWVVEG